MLESFSNPSHKEQMEELALFNSLFSIRQYVCIQLLSVLTVPSAARHGVIFSPRTTCVPPLQVAPIMPPWCCKPLQVRNDVAQVPWVPGGGRRRMELHSAAR
jgi:hypothetical protein